MAWQVFTSLGKYFYNPWILVFLGVMPLMYFIFLWLVRLATPSKTEIQGAGPGCLIQFLGVFLQAFGIALVLLILLPVLLGVSDKVSWQAVEPMGFVAIRSGLFAMILVTLVSFFPWIGNLLGSSPGTEAFLLSWLTFRFLSPIYLEAFIGNNYRSLFPAWWLVLILCVLAWLMSRLMMTLVMMAGRVFFQKGIFSERTHRWWIETVGPSLDILGGILPFLYYARWVAYSFKGA